jgi:hypothetical protein
MPDFGMRFLQTLSTYVQFFFHRGNEFREEGFLNNVNLVVVRLAAVNKRSVKLKVASRFNVN